MMAGWELPLSDCSAASQKSSCSVSTSLRTTRPPVGPGMGYTCPSTSAAQPSMPTSGATSMKETSLIGARDRSRSGPRARSPSNHPSESPPRCNVFHRARVLMRSLTADPPPHIPGVEFWQHPLWNFSADARSRLPREQSHRLRWILPCGGAGAEIAVAQALHRIAPMHVPRNNKQCEPQPTSRY